VIEDVDVKPGNSLDDYEAHAHLARAVSRWRGLPSRPRSARFRQDPRSTAVASTTARPFVSTTREPSFRPLGPTIAIVQLAACTSIPMYLSIVLRLRCRPRGLLQSVAENP